MGTAEGGVIWTDENYQELFRNDMVEIKSQKELLSHIDWAKIMDSKTTIKEVISENDAAVIVIEESSNYIDVALMPKRDTAKSF